MSLLRRIRGWRGGGTGARGERYAARWLRRRGYTILARNVRRGRDEADLVAETPDGGTVVIVEVKTRTTDHHLPEWSVDRRKQFHLVRLASRLQREPRFAARGMRFDAIAVTWTDGGGRPRVRHYEGAFDSPF